MRLKRKESVIFLSAGLLLELLIGYGVYRFPALQREYLWGFRLPMLLLGAYAVIGWRVGKAGADTQTALQEGRRVGLLLATVMAIHLWVEYFVTLPAALNAPFSLALFPVLFAGFGVAGFRAGRATGRAAMGTLGSIWCAVFCIVLLCVFGFGVNYLFISHLSEILRYSPEFKRSGIHDLATFTVANSLESCASHLIIAPILALFWGSIGGGFGAIVYRRDHVGVSGTPEGPTSSALNQPIVPRAG